MKFKFCSDGDCPLWALAAFNALSTLRARKFKRLVYCVIHGRSEDNVMEILKDTNLSSREESARAAAVIRWTINQSRASNCTSIQLTRDLLMLGVPRTHAVSLAQAVDEAQPLVLERDRLFNNHVTDVKVTPGPSAAIDSITLSLTTPLNNGDEYILDRIQAKLLLDELKKVYCSMKDLPC